MFPSLIFISLISLCKHHKFLNIDALNNFSKEVTVENKYIPRLYWYSQSYIWKLTIMSFMYTLLEGIWLYTC